MIRTGKSEWIINFKYITIEDVKILESEYILLKKYFKQLKHYKERKRRRLK